MPVGRHSLNPTFGRQGEIMVQLMQKLILRTSVGYGYADLHLKSIQTACFFNPNDAFAIQIRF